LPLKLLKERNYFQFKPTAVAEALLLAHGCFYACHFTKIIPKVLTKHIVQFKETRPNHYKAQNRPELVWMNDAEMAKQPLRQDGGCKLPPVIEPKKRRRIPLK